MSTITPFLAGFSLAVVLFSLAPLSPRPAAAAPDDTLGMAILAARVNSDGNLVSGSGATEATRNSPGEYRVNFDRDVSGCYYSANNSGYFASPLYAVTLPFPDVANRVWVFLYNNSGFADGSFYLLVYCSR